jgi:Cu/Zn superoxide dismutase
MKANRRGPRFTAAAGALALALAGTTLAFAGAASAAQAAPAPNQQVHNSHHKTTLHLNLAPMPTGTVSTGYNADGTMFIQVNATGFTPGSAHWVDVFSNGMANPFGEVTANSAGQLVATVNVPSIPDGSQVWLLDNGTNTNPIAKSSPVMTGNSGPYRLHAVETGFPPGSLRGHATLVYNLVARTLTVTLTASGLTPGAHAAHIHDGYCPVQGPVQYMLTDFTANSHGNISSETRVVTGVTTSPLTAGFYLNVHQGNSNNILSNGQPTIYFRPLLCADL